MKKSALKKDFVMEIKKSANRFLSILFIVALGVAFFSGIQSAAPDMRYTADQYFDEHGLADLKIVSTLGLTEENIESIKQIEGVASVHPGYMTDVLCGEENTQKVIHIESILPGVNEVDVEEGRLPKETGECFLDIDFAEENGYHVGDTIVFSEGTDNEEERILRKETYTVSGIGSGSAYISFERGSSTMGTGEVSGFAYLLPEDFDSEVYTHVYVTVEGAEELTAYTDEYDECVKKVQDLIEAQTEEMGEQRYQSIVSDARESIADANKDLEDGKKDLEDGTAEAKEELRSAKLDMLEGEKAIWDGEQELLDGREEILNAKQELLDQQEELEDAKEQLQSGQEQLNDAKSELEEQEQKYQEEYDSTSEQLIRAQEELSAGADQLESAWTQYEELRMQVEEAQQNLTALQQLADAGMATAEQTEQLAQLQAVVQENEPLVNQMLQELTQRQEQVDDSQEEIDQGWAALSDAKDQINSAKEQIEEQEQTLTENQETIKKAEEALQDGWKEIEEAQKTLEEGKDEIRLAKAELSDGQSEYFDGKEDAVQEIRDAEQEILDGEQEIADAEQELNEIEHPQWYVMDRDSAFTEYSSCGDNAERIKNIGRVFPVIFFLVAALVSLTTMTRMVEEERTQIGTLKALGYGKAEIMWKYLGYAFLATVLGSVLGFLIGEKILPFIIIYAYRIMFPHMTGMVIPYNMEYAFMASGAALLCTIGATLASSYRELQDTPAVLMRPPAPKEGKRVWLEYVPFLWKRLNFTWKSTIRNLFRYKKRFFMTILGIGGCMALLLVGFGLRDSIMDVARIQYREIQLYDGMAVFEDKATTQEKQDVMNQMEDNTEIEAYAEVLMKQFTLEGNGEEQEVYLFIMEDLSKLEQFIKLRDRTTQEAYTLNDEGIILTEKIAKLLGVSEGDTVLLKDEDMGNVEVTISHITENYMTHYLYMTPALYEKLYGQEPNYNSIIFQSVQEDEEALNAIGEELLENDSIVNLSYTSSLEQRVNDMLGSLDIVIFVLIVSAGMLAFVVLYNLNNINVNERKRELATLKVLGFYDGEVSAYMYRENILLTVIGSAVGVLFGILLHRYIIVTVEIDICMFGRNINGMSYLYSILFTFGFSLIVNIFMHFKLKKIDMVESLKSVE